MVRLSIPPNGDDRARRDEIRLRELDRSNRRAFDAFADSNLVARHRWYGSGNIVANTDVALNLAGHWATARDDSVARFQPLTDFDTPGFYLQRAGRWSITLAVASDAAFAGSMRVVLAHTGGDMFDGAAALRSTQPRATGYGGAGALDQLITWSGPVTDTEALVPLTVMVRHATAGTGMAATSWWLQANYLGSGAWPGATIAPVDAVPQDDEAAVNP